MMRVVAPLLLILAMALTMGGCSRSAGNLDVQSDATRGAALEALAEGHHKRADIALKQERRQDALQEMDSLLSLAEGYRGQTPGSHDVVFDAAARLARMHAEDGDLQKAEAAARRGLAQEDDAPPSLFRGYLHQTLADILERKGDLRGAVDEHTVAIELFKKLLGPGAQLPTPPQPTEPGQ